MTAASIYGFIDVQHGSIILGYQLSPMDYSRAGLPAYSPNSLHRRHFHVPKGWHVSS